MIQEIHKLWGAFQAASGENPHSLALMEGPTNCNRRCEYCEVPDRWDPEKNSTLEQTYQQIDKLYEMGYRVLNYVGGEPLAECLSKGEIVSRKYHRCEHGVAACAFVESEEREENAFYRTKDGITFAEHTLGVVEYASRKGMIANVTTNGDFLDNTYYLHRFKEAGLDILTFSLHSFNEAGLRDIISKARATAQVGIIPIISVVFTADRADMISQYARTCVANGILFSAAVVQEIGGGFSAVPAESNIPSSEQQKAVFESLLPLKKTGFIRNNLNYLTKATDFPGNSWKCNPEKDAFIHIRAQGKNGEVGVCSEVRIGLGTDETDLSSMEWRRKKRELVEGCKGCLYSCFYEAENPYFRGDIRTILNMILIRTGHAGFVRWLGERAVGKSSDIIPVPQSRMEEIQTEVKDYHKLQNKLKRRGADLINTLATPFVFAATSAVLGVIYLQARRKRISSDEVSRALLTSIIYPGILEGGKEKKNK